RLARSSPRTLTRKGRIASALVLPNGDPPCFDCARATTKCIGSRLTAPVAADPARRLRRVGEEDIEVMVSLLVASTPLVKGTSASLQPQGLTAAMPGANCTCD